MKHMITAHVVHFRGVFRQPCPLEDLENSVGGENERRQHEPSIWTWRELPDVSDRALVAVFQVLAIRSYLPVRMTSFGDILPIKWIFSPRTLIAVAYGALLQTWTSQTSQILKFYLHYTTRCYRTKTHFRRRAGWRIIMYGYPPTTPEYLLACFKEGYHGWAEWKWGCPVSMCYSLYPRLWRHEAPGIPLPSHEAFKRASLMSAGIQSWVKQEYERCT